MIGGLSAGIVGASLPTDPSLAFVATDRTTTNADSIAIPNVLAGDIVIVAAATFDGTPATTPDGVNWPVLQSEVRSTFASLAVSARVAASDGEFTASGTWTNALRVGYVHYRPSNGSVSVRGTPTKANSGASSITVPALSSPLATSWGVSVAGMVTSVTFSSGQTATPRGTQGSTGRLSFMDSNGPTSGTYAEQTIVCSGTHNGACAISIELELT